MLLKNYRKHMFRPRCNPSFQSVHCVAHLDQDISEVLPYLNAVLGGDSYTNDPPALTLRVHGKLISLHSKEIFINALSDDEEADKILSWLKKEINETWEKRADIEPNFSTPEYPNMIEILRLLPRTNCGKCKEPTCIVFASQAVKGLKSAHDCPEMEEPNRLKLTEYLSRFNFDM